MKNNSMYRNPPLSNFILYWLCIILIPLFLVSHLYLLTTILLIIIHYGGHEAVHGCLTPPFKYRKQINFISGVVGYALVGHNFIFIRWSHLAHHKFGRTDSNYTIDGKETSDSSLGKLKYYLGLFGVSYLYHELAGYLYPILGDKYHILSRRFKKHFYHNKTYFFVQFFVLTITFCLFYLGGLKFLFCKMLFMIYWGLFQNVAHYGLKIGDYDHSEFAARTYRINSIIEFFIFRGGAYHLEHHVFPNVPGPNLNSIQIKEKLKEKLGFYPEPTKGTFSYIKDVFKQFYGPNGGSKISKDWR